MATISDTGRVTIPEPIRKFLGLEPGSEVVFECKESGEVVIHKENENSDGETRRHPVRPTLWKS